MPETSFYFPEKLKYTYHGQREFLLGVLSVKDDIIHIVKETDPGIWLVYLGVRQTFALYNLLTAGLIKCTLRGVDPQSVSL